MAGRIRLYLGDLTGQEVDVIVNAANASLLGGGGVDGAIHRRGGPAILDDCRQIRRARWPEGLPTGEAVITTAGQLAARFVIHTVGPIYGEHGGKEAELLANCYRNALLLANQHALASIAFPAISTGVYGYPANEAAEIVSRTLQESLLRDTSISEVRLVFFAQQDLDTFLQHQKFTG